jgi:hypothetical protein
MSIWRSEQANKLEAAVHRLLVAEPRPSESVLEEAEANLIEFKAETLQWAMPIGFTLGLMIAAFGVRALSQFVDPAATATISEPQRWWFNMIDILFTGALLAGGADPIHKLLDLYRKFVEKTSRKAAGAR